MNNNNNNFTPLVGVKWTRSTLLKALEQTYTYYYHQVIKSNFDPKRKNEIINELLDTYVPIFNTIHDYGVTVKKQ